MSVTSFAPRERVRDSSRPHVREALTDSSAQATCSSDLQRNHADLQRTRIIAAADLLGNRGFFIFFSNNKRSSGGQGIYIYILWRVGAQHHATIHICIFIIRRGWACSMRRGASQRDVTGNAHLPLWGGRESWLWAVAGCCTWKT